MTLSLPRRIPHARILGGRGGLRVIRPFLFLVCPCQHDGQNYSSGTADFLLVCINNESAVKLLTCAYPYVALVFWGGRLDPIPATKVFDHRVIPP